MSDLISKNGMANGIAATGRWNRRDSRDGGSADSATAARPGTAAVASASWTGADHAVRSHSGSMNQNRANEKIDMSRLDRRGTRELARWRAFAHGSCVVVRGDPDALPRSADGGHWQHG